MIRNLYNTHACYEKPTDEKMRRIATGTIVTVLMVFMHGGGVLGSPQLRCIAGPLGYERHYRGQEETGFYISRVRVGDVHWFPSLVILSEHIPESEALSYIGKDVLVFGDDTKIPVDPSQQLAIDSWSAIMATRIVPVENMARQILRIIDVPHVLDDAETVLQFRVHNPFPFTLDNVEIFLDVDGHFQFKDGERTQYTTHHKQISIAFNAHEEKDFTFPLIPSELPRDNDYFAMSIMVIGYYAEDETLHPVYAFWEKHW